MKTHFIPIHTTRIAQQVADQIRAMVKSSQLGPGERLPPIHELARQFDVSRATVREAIQVLSALGYLKVKHGVGIFVAEDVHQLDDPSFWVPWLDAHRTEVLALLEVREALEVKSATLAAAAVRDSREVTRELLQSLETNLAQMEEAVTKYDINTLERLDIEFHTLIAELGANPYLLRLSKSINYLFADRRAVLALPGRGEQSLVEHHQILDAIQRGDAEAAGEAMARHLKSTKESVRMLRLKMGSGPREVER